MYISVKEYRERLEKSSNIFLHQECYNQLGYQINVELTDEERDELIDELVNNYDSLLKNKF